MVERWGCSNTYGWQLNRERAPTFGNLNWEIKWFVTEMQQKCNTSAKNSKGQLLQIYSVKLLRRQTQTPGTSSSWLTNQFYAYPPPCTIWTLSPQLIDINQATAVRDDDGDGFNLEKFTFLAICFLTLNLFCPQFVFNSSHTCSGPYLKYKVEILRLRVRFGL